MKVLIIESQIDVRVFLKRGFENECYVVDLAEDAEAGLWRARIDNYDLIILSDSLPKKGGKEICRLLRSEGLTTPVLILSENNEVETKVELLNVGADDCISRPYVFEEILARSRALLRRPKVILSNIITLGDISLDSVKHQVVRAGKFIMLTRKELMLLEYFMRNPGVVLSRGMLLEHVWDMNADLFSNTIESHILTLRKKIDLEGKEKCITTIPGRGYRFEIG